LRLEKPVLRSALSFFCSNAINGLPAYFFNPVRQERTQGMKMDINLDVLSLRELKDLQGRVARAIASYEDRKKKEALAELEQKAREMGYSLAELLALQGAGKAPRKRTQAVPKYANPANSADTWTGRGRKPRWFIEALASGRAPEELAI
jgi:DNA-binding protein H-NS